VAVAWDPEEYLRFANERHRAFTDLVAHIPQHAPEHVVDLGCGPGSATLQWVPEHLALLPTFLGWLAPGGSLAIQMPANFDQPSHALLAALARSPRWAPAIGHLVRDTPVADPATYLRSLRTAGARCDVWETTYLHLLSGPDAVLGWMRGTGLRPFLAALEEGVSADECRAFLDTYTEALRSAYPAEPDGHTVLPFRRIFAVATVP